MHNMQLGNRTDADKLPLTFMTTVFTLPVMTFNRYDPKDSSVPQPDGGLLKSADTFGAIGERTPASTLVNIFTYQNFKWALRF
jgi:hypothetical protein